MKGEGARIALPRTAAWLMRLCAAAGGIMIVAGLLLAPSQLWPNVLLASYFWLELSLAGLVFVALHYVTGAAWHVALRRVPEAMAILLPLGAIGLGIVILLHPGSYPWTAAGTFGSGGVFVFKRFWLSLPFFRVRTAIVLACWVAFAAAIVRTSRRQDHEGGERLTRRNVRLSAAFLVVLAITLVPASSDWLMSLEPSWYSTVFGIYDFASMFLGGLAAITLLAILIARLAPAEFILTEGQLHDLGKLLFAFSTFWAYIWFCQYMLIWYANLPEETSYYVARLRGPWGVLFIANLLMNWAIPFLVLLPQKAKKSPVVLVKVCALVLLGRWLDLSLIILPPAVSPAHAALVWNAALMLGAVSVFALSLFKALQGAALLPLKDPDLAESLHASRAAEVRYPEVIKHARR